jgi:hypothetical protein
VFIFVCAVELLFLLYRLLFMVSFISCCVVYSCGCLAATQPPPAKKQSKPNPNLTITQDPAAIRKEQNETHARGVMAIGNSRPTRALWAWTVVQASSFSVYRPQIEIHSYIVDTTSSQDPSPFCMQCDGSPKQHRHIERASYTCSLSQIKSLVYLTKALYLIAQVVAVSTLIYGPLVLSWFMAICNVIAKACWSANALKVQR